MDTITADAEDFFRSFWGEQKLAVLFQITKELESFHPKDDVRHLPLIWFRIAHASRHGLKQSDRVTVENHLLMVANNLNLRNSMPVVTPELAKKIVNLEFIGNDMDILEGGINPFCLLVPNEGNDIECPNSCEISLARDLIHQYDKTGTIINNMLGVVDLRLICDWKHTTKIMEAQYIVLVALLGQEHKLVKRFERFLNKYKANQDHYNSHMSNAPLNTNGYQNRHAIILRFVQVVLFQWFNNKDDGYFERFLENIDGKYTSDWKSYACMPTLYQPQPWPTLILCKGKGLGSIGM